MAWHRLSRLRKSSVLSLSMLPMLWAAQPVSALELKGRSLFVRPPWDAVMTTYYSNVWARSAEYYLTIVLPEGAGAPLGRLTVQQISGADWQFPFSVERTRAFIGRPRHEQSKVPVQASFNADTRRFTLDFPTPVPAGSTLTVVLKPWYNPSQGDIYQFDVVAYPAGANPEASPVGVVNLRIYDLLN